MLNSSSHHFDQLEEFDLDVHHDHTRRLLYWSIGGIYLLVFPAMLTTFLHDSDAPLFGMWQFADAIFSLGLLATLALFAKCFYNSVYCRTSCVAWMSFGMLTMISFGSSITGMVLFRLEHDSFADESVSRIIATICVLQLKLVVAFAVFMCWIYEGVCELLRY